MTYQAKRSNGPGENSDHNFAVSIAYLRGVFEPRNMIRESKFPIRVSRPLTWSGRGNRDSENTYLSIG